MKNRCSILFFCWEIEKMYPVLEKNCFVCARAWSSSAHATQTMRRCWLCWGFSLRYSGFVIYCQIKIQNTNMYKIPNKREVYEELGYPWERFQEYIEHDLVSSMQSLHVELGSFWLTQSMCALILWIPITLMIVVVVPHTLQFWGKYVSLSLLLCGFPKRSLSCLLFHTLNDS